MKINKKIGLLTLGLCSTAFALPIVLTSCNNTSQLDSGNGNENVPPTNGDGNNNQKPNPDNGSNGGDNNVGDNNIVDSLTIKNMIDFNKYKSIQGVNFITFKANQFNSALKDKSVSEIKTLLNLNNSNSLTGETFSLLINELQFNSFGNDVLNYQNINLDSLKNTNLTNNVVINSSSTTSQEYISVTVTFNLKEKATWENNKRTRLVFVVSYTKINIANKL